jgi:hypothetical protein
MGNSNSIAGGLRAARSLRVGNWRKENLEDISWDLRFERDNRLKM